MWDDYQSALLHQKQGFSAKLCCFHHLNLVLWDWLQHPNTNNNQSLAHIAYSHRSIFWQKYYYFPRWQKNCLKGVLESDSALWLDGAKCSCLVCPMTIQNQMVALPSDRRYALEISTDPTSAQWNLQIWIVFAMNIAVKIALSNFKQPFRSKKSRLSLCLSFCQITTQQIRMIQHLFCRGTLLGIFDKALFDKGMEGRWPLVLVF